MSYNKLYGIFFIFALFIGLSSSALHLQANQPNDNRVDKTLKSSGLTINSSEVEIGYMDTFTSVRQFVLSDTIGYLIISNEDGRYFTTADFSDHANPIQLDSLEFENPIYNFTVSGSYAYLSASNEDFHGILYIVDISDPTNLVTVSQKPIPQSPDSSSQYGLGNPIISGSYLYLSIVESTYNPEPSHVYYYILVINISDPQNPTIVGFKSTTQATTDIAIIDSFAYLTSRNGLEVIDISDPTNPTSIYQLELPALGSMTISDNMLYIAGLDVILSQEDDDFYILDISNPAEPITVGSFGADFNDGLPSNSNVYVEGKLAYLSSYYDVKLFDISDPTAPVFYGSTPSLPDGISNTVLSNGYLFMITGGIYYLDLTQAPKLQYQHTYFPLIRHD